jgi:hypothetical protein
MKLVRKIVILLLASVLFAAFLPVSELQAYRTIYKSYIETNLNKIEFLGEKNGEQFGAEVASGDINGDGVEDLIIGSPFYSSGEVEWNGKVSVIFGTRDLDKQVYDMKKHGPDLVIYGRSSGDQLGMSLTTGDFNNDGYDDVLMGAYNALDDDERAGKAFLIYGREEFVSSTWLLAIKNADVEIKGEREGDGFGLSVYMGDINQDDIDDILVGAPFALSTKGVPAGKVYGYEGSTGGQMDVDSVVTPQVFKAKNGADVVFHAQGNGERFGAEIASGDVIGGQYKDVAISAYFADGPDGPQTGKVYLFKGRKNYAKHVREVDGVIVGKDSYDWFGFSMDTANVDVGSKEDLLISSFPYSNREKNGGAYVFYGGAEFGDADYSFSGREGESLMGSSVGFGDFDGDGKEDFVFGAPGIGSVRSVESGEIYLFYKDLLGGESSFDLENDEATSIVVGENEDDWFGAKIDVLDFNGDGVDDIAVSSRYADRYDLETGLVGESDDGKVYLLLGNSSPFGEEVVIREPGDEFVTRGDFLAEVIEQFNIKENRADFINSCYEHREFCFFVFSGQSDFSGLELEPEIILYPDVPYGSEYYEATTIGTMLGLLNGFTNEEGTPFKPEANITRIQALKVVLGVNQLVDPLYRFQLIDIFGGIMGLKEQESYFSDVNPKVAHMWWYPRFTNFAYNERLVEDGLFRPDDNVTQNELDALIGKTLKLIDQIHEEETFDLYNS